jgi:hypothetical protein
MEIIRKEDLNLPLAPAQAPQIDWGKDFEEWSVEQQNRYLKRLCSALNHSADLIQNERNEVLEECHRMNKCVENADEAVRIQKAIVLKTITDFNKEKQELITRLQELEAENKLQAINIKRLTNGNNDRLAN